jgi:hypothetical protein
VPRRTYGERRLDTMTETTRGRAMRSNSRTDDGVRRSWYDRWYGRMACRGKATCLRTRIEGKQRSQAPVRYESDTREGKRSSPQLRYVTSVSFVVRAVRVNDLVVVIRHKPAGPYDQQERRANLVMHITGHEKETCVCVCGVTKI